MANAIDHIVHLVPLATLDDAIAGFAALGFNVISGGRDATTSTALIVLKDGVYIEIVAFNTSRSSVPHPWRREKPGWVDWALLARSDDDLIATLNARAERELSDVKYATVTTAPGGARVQTDGRVIKWQLTAPMDHRPGVVPFYIADLTPRTWRVPLTPATNIEHDNGAVGVEYVRLLCIPAELARLQARLSTAIGSGLVEGGWWRIQTPSGETWPKLFASWPKSDDERRWLADRGKDVALYEIGIRVDGGMVGVHATPYARLVFTS